MNRAVLRNLVAVVAAFALASPLLAQDWKGRGRLSGDVSGPDGKPIEGATVTLRLNSDPELGPAPLKTDKKGKWSYLGLAGANWNVSIEAAGFVPSEGTVKVSEGMVTPPVVIKLRAAEAAAATTSDPKLGAAQAAIDSGDAFLQQKNGAAARAEYEKALPVLEGPNRVIVLKRIAMCQMLEENDAAAVETLKTVLVDAPQDADALRLIIDRLTVLHREAEAQQYIAQLPQGAEVDPNTLLNMGINLYNENKLPEALAKFEQVVAARPDWPDGYYYRGLTQLGQGNSAPAKADFEKVLALDPNHQYANDCREFLKSL